MSSIHPHFWLSGVHIGHLGKLKKVGYLDYEAYCIGINIESYGQQVKKSGMPPGARAGFSMCTHKKRAVLFGGVVDTEEQGQSFTWDFDRLIFF